MTAKAIARIGAGAVMTQVSADRWQETLAHIAVDTAGYRQAAQRFKMQHRDFTTASGIDHLVERCRRSVKTVA